jgi:PPOX class probable F420-dependent enzyme
MLPSSVRSFLATGPIAHVATLRSDGSPRISLAWVGVEDDEIVIGTLFDQPKLRDLRRDPRIALSFVTGERNAMGLDEYLVLHGRARVTEGGAADLLAKLAKTYIGPDAVFPPMPDPPPGYVTRIAVERISGLGPWRRDEA